MRYEFGLSSALAPSPQGEGWGEGHVDQRRTIAENESEETDSFSRGNALRIAHYHNKCKTLMEGIDGFLKRTPDRAAHQERKAIAPKRDNPRADAVEPTAWWASRRIEIPPPTADRSLHRGFLLP